MDVLALVLILVLLGGVVWLVGGPLRGGVGAATSEREAAEIDGLRAAKEAKYREIRELELDYRTGKLSEADFRGQDRQRRAEAVDLLRRLDELGAGDEDPRLPS